MKSIHSGDVTTKNSSPKLRKAQFRLAVRGGETKYRKKFLTRTSKEY